ncbi:MAG: LysR family transcriptional regulator [Myxococcales bacterium]|nr:LysR family transcriptional regulator [Myxococcales bacterium]
MTYDLPVFLAVVREGSASRAAAALGVGVSTVTRRIGALEAELGSPLFVRSPDGVELTPAGRELLPHAEAAERALLAGRAAVAGLESGVRGTVTVALPSDMLLLVVLPRLRPFLDAHPDLVLAVDQHERVSDLSRLEVDIAVRVEVPERGEELVASRLRTVRFAVFCSESALRDVRDPSDPSCHRWIGMTRPDPDIDALAGNRYALRFSSPVSVRHAVAAGLGSAVLPTTFGHAVPGLVEVPIPFDRSFPLWLISHRAVRSSPPVAAVWAELERLLREAPDDDVMLRASLGVYGWDPPSHP